MKECESIAGLFIDLHERRLDSTTEKLMREHFLTCTACREDFKWYGITVQALATLEKVSPPKDFMAQLEAKLYGSPRSMWYSTYSDFFRNLFTSSPYLPLPVGVATLAFMVVLGFAVYNQVPSEMLPASPPLQAQQGPGGASPQGEMVAAGDADGPGAAQWRLTRPFSSTPESLLPNQIARIPEYTPPNPKSLGDKAEASAGRFLTVAERIGGDNLTVESPSVENAVESLKRILPDISGRLVEEKSRDRIGERVLGVLIPSGAYGHLATELVNHGAVQLGAGPDKSTPAPSRAGNNNVILYIRFVQSH